MFICFQVSTARADQFSAAHYIISTALQDNCVFEINVLTLSSLSRHSAAKVGETWLEDLRCFWKARGILHLSIVRALECRA